MSIIYICTQGTELHVKENQFVVYKQGQKLAGYPVEPVDQIEIFGNVSITTPEINLCMKKGIVIAFYSYSGYYNGRFEPPAVKKRETPKAAGCVGR